MRKMPKTVLLVMLLLGTVQVAAAQDERALTKNTAYLKFHSEVMSQDRVRKG